jgi:cytochrome c oxidase cbb3-type subunit 1
MSDTPSLTQPPAASAISADATDVSCRLPLFVLFAGAAFWGVIASALALVASIKFHSPGFLADTVWLTYGRVHAATKSAQVYGFALPAGLGVALWILARLGGNRVSQPWLIAAGGKLWNLGVLVGLVAILAGDNTGFEHLQMPRYAAMILFVGYLLMGLWTVLTLKNRREAGLSSPQWFLLVALFWFPWIFSTANLLLLVCPARGINQAIVAWWYSNNLTLVWLSLVGLAAVFHFVPSMAGRPRHRDYLASFVLWTLVLFGSWAGIPNSAPVPAWMPSLSTVATVLILVPLLAVAMMLWQGRGALPGAADGRDERQLVPTGVGQGPNAALWFIRFGIAAWLLAGAMKIAGALPGVGSITQFTWFTVAQSQLNASGFFAMILFGSIYAILPQVAGLEWPFAKWVRAHFWLATTGILLVVVPLAAGGIVQGMKLGNPAVAFADVTTATLPFLRASTVGDLLLLVGQLFFLGNVIGLMARYGWTRWTPVYHAITAELKPAEVKP